MTSIQLTALPDGPYRLKGDGSHARTGWKEDA